AWRRDHAELTGFDALIDLTRVESIAYESAEQMQRLASLAADTDTQHAEGRIAIVAASEMTFGLSRMYQSYRQVDDRSSRTLTVVRTRELALDWLANED
ncbi:MAG: hypothetical protein HOH74_32795, partial [Gemmatimonadetes bacterium]|nr:hypothetical protein [Gemmatimonadota bacterium]